MKYLSSKRHEKTLQSGQLQISIPKKLRMSIFRTVLENSILNDWDGVNVTFDLAFEMLKTFYGEEQIFAHGKPVDFKELILQGYPPKALDAIEAFIEKLPSAERQQACEQQLNGVFEIHNSQWRILGGNLYLIDSGYLHTEINAKLHNLLSHHQIAGVLDEFNQAMTALTENSANDAVIYAHRSVESTMKVALGTNEHKTFTPLVKELIASGVIPKYYEDFYLHFEKMMAAVTKERNKPGGGHGQGSEIIAIPKNLAEFAVNLSAVMNMFILKAWLDKKIVSPPMSADDIPF
jgi:hypothetical protein